MSDLAVRAAIVAVILLAVAALTWARRRPDAPSSIVDSEFAPGVYLFSSRSCLECDTARGRLLDRLGAGSFSEVTWEGDREMFGSAGVNAVPTTLLVADDGTATFVEGVPGSVLDSFSP